MISAVYSSSYDNYSIYKLLNSMPPATILNNYLKIFELFKTLSPKRKISIIDTMHGDGANLPLLKLAASLQGIEISELAVHDRVPIAADAEKVYVCDIYDLPKHMAENDKKGKKYDLAVSVFSGVNCATPYKRDGLKKICQVSKKIADVSIHTLTHPQHWEVRKGAGSSRKIASSESFGVDFPPGEYFLHEFYSIDLDSDHTADMENKYTYKHIQDINIRDTHGSLKGNIFIDGSRNHISVFTTEALLNFGDVKFIDSCNNLTKIYDSDEEYEALNSVYADGQLCQLLILD